MNPYQSILITGGGGMLAHALIGAAQKRGLNFHALGRAECDITQPRQVRDVFEKHRPTLVLNCAAHTGVDACETESDKAYAINATGVETLARLAGDFGSKLVHYSTDFVFDGKSDRPYRPDDSPRPLSVYGASKLAGEQKIAQIAPIASLVIRTSWLFGTHGDCFPGTMVALARLKKPLRVVNDQWGCPTYTRDLAEATFSLLDQNASGIFHVTNCPSTNWYDFAKASLKAFAVEADLESVNTEEWLKIRPRQAIRPMYSVLDLSAYKEVTGNNIRSWQQALNDYRAEEETG